MCIIRLKPVVLLKTCQQRRRFEGWQNTLAPQRFLMKKAEEGVKKIRHY